MASRFRWPRFFQRRQEVDCTQVRDLSSDYVEGEMAEPLNSRMREHMRWCGACAAFIDTLRATLSMLRVLPKHKAPPNLREAIKRRLQGSSPD